MPKHKNLFAIFLICFALPTSPADAKRTEKKPAEPVVNQPGVLWQDPTDLESRNLFYGPGGKDDEPHGRITFVKEDLEGTNPKFDVRDESGVKWKVKLGLEARPENVASRLTWAAGYFTNEDYFVKDLHVEGMPPVLHRGWKLVDPDGTVHNVRLKREVKGEKKIGTWKWRSNPFTGTRELNGLRVMMALINNWDLKDVNNAVYQEGDKVIYMISDLGSSFGSAGRTWPLDKSKDNFESYSRSRFIRRLTPTTVDFQVPARPRWVLFVNPKEAMMRVHLGWIGRNIPREDARWMGHILARLSPKQLNDAFIASGYSPDEAKAFCSVLATRITALTDL